MSDPTVITVDRQADKLVIQVQPDHLDDTNISTLRKEVEEAAGGSPQLPVILDLGKVTFVVSLSLGEFVELSQQFKGRGQRLVFTSLQPAIRQIFAVTRLDKVFEIQDRRTTAP